MRRGATLRWRNTGGRPLPAAQPRSAGFSLSPARSLAHLSAPRSSAAAAAGGGGRGGVARPPAGSPRGAAAPGSPCPAAWPAVRAHRGLRGCRAGPRLCPAPRGRRRTERTPPTAARRPLPAAQALPGARRGPRRLRGCPASCRPRGPPPARGSTGPGRAPQRRDVRLAGDGPALRRPSLCLLGSPLRSDREHFAFKAKLLQKTRWRHEFRRCKQKRIN